MPARILVVEDNPENLELKVYLLEAFGYSPLTARNGREALAIVQEIIPDLIICDLFMPEMDGFEFCSLVKADSRLATVPLIAVTALAMAGDRARVLAAGFDGYIAKPIAPETFIDEVESFLKARPG